jgi:hypothetical protein
VDEAAPRLVVDRRHLDAAPDQLASGGLDIRNDNLEPSHGSRFDGGEAGADRDGAGGSGRGQLDEAQLLVDLVVVIRVETDLIDVEGLGAIDVGDGNGNELELPIHRLTPLNEDFHPSGRSDRMLS